MDSSSDEHQPMQVFIYLADVNRGLQFLQLGMAIIIMSSSGTLGRYIDLPASMTIWIRCVIGALALLLVLLAAGIEWRFKSKGNKTLIWSSIFLGVHWVTYFYSLQLSTVALGMLSLFTYPVITVLLEPLILKVKFQKMSVFLGCFAFVGIAFLIPELSLENEHSLGIAVGVVSAFFYSIRNILLKKQVADQSGITIMFHQLVINSVLLIPFLFLIELPTMDVVIGQWKPLLLLALFTTAAGHTLLVLSFRYFSISTASVLTSLVPLVGIFLGFLFLSEVPGGKTYIGGGMILLTVIVESVLSARRGG
ncbi:MAG: EamA family transporter [Cyclobacteriaceae bacterium]